MSQKGTSKVEWVCRCGVVTPLALSLSLMTACDVPEPPGSSGIRGSTACPATLVVVESDYQSTNVALVSMEGNVLTESLASSATAGLGGDAVPTAMTTRGSVVLLDRGRGDRIVWIDPETTATTELSVATGFASNPYDYAEVAPNKAYVPRYSENRDSGQEPFDVGSDVLIVDAGARLVTGSIDMRPSVVDAPGVQPRPNRVVTYGNRAFVLLTALTSTFTAGTSSRIVEIDTATDTVLSTLTLTGFSNCGGLVPSPFRPELAVLCSGPINSTGTSTLVGSGVVTVNVTSTPRIDSALTASTLGNSPVAFWGAYAADGVLLVTTFGYLDDLQNSVVQDQLHQIDLVSGEHIVVLRANAFSLGGVVCESRCGACFATNADAGVIHRFDLDPIGTLSNETPIIVERTIGLPPRDLGVVE